MFSSIIGHFLSSLGDGMNLWMSAIAGEVESFHEVQNRNMTRVGSLCHISKPKSFSFLYRKPFTGYLLKWDSLQELVKFHCQHAVFVT